jgi:PIN domain nuclease of toxin-antitoxin system
MIILDTHIWLWWINQDTQKLGEHLHQWIDQEETVAVSAISCFEVAWLQCHKRISLHCELNHWFEYALNGSDIALLPISPKIASKAATLPEHHSDPQDRLIIATSIIYKARLASKDNKFRLYNELKDYLL